MVADPKKFSPAQKRSILLEYRFRIDNRNIGQICAKYGLSKGAFQRLREEMGAQFAGEEEIVIAGVYEGAHTIDRLAGYLDYRNHAGYREAEVQGFIDNLVQIGVLEKKAGEWRFTRRAPAARNRFVFTAPRGAAHQPIHFGKLRHPHWRPGDVEERSEK